MSTIHAALKSRTGESLGFKLADAIVDLVELAGKRRKRITEWEFNFLLDISDLIEIYGSKTVLTRKQIALIRKLEMKLNRSSSVYSTGVEQRRRA